MPIAFPDLRASRCVNFASCGWIETKDSAILRVLKRQPKPWMVARYRSPSGIVYVRAGFGGEDGTHCHLDFASPDFFPDKKGPKQTHKVADIQAVLERLVGQQIKCGLEGDFLITREELPPLIQASASETHEDSVSIRMTAGRFSIQGAPIRSITWAIRREGDSAILTFEATKPGVVNESYLVDAFQVITSGFTAFMGGGIPRGER